jgi:transcriptional regulator with XRE-family HTH domain
VTRLARLAPAVWRANEVNIGDRIALARDRVGLSQTDLAAVLGVSRGLVGQWKTHRKKPGRENVLKIAHATLVRVGWLVGEDSTFTVLGDGRVRLRYDRTLDKEAAMRVFDAIRAADPEWFPETKPA